MFLQTHEGTLRGRVNTACVFCIQLNLEFLAFQLRYRIYQSIDLFVSQWKDFFSSQNALNVLVLYQMLEYRRGQYDERWGLKEEEITVHI